MLMIKGLINRFGKNYLNDLKEDAARYVREGNHFNRYDVIQVHNTYKYLTKNKIWVFTQREFNYYRDLIETKQ